MKNIFLPIVLLSTILLNVLHAETASNSKLRYKLETSIAYRDAEYLALDENARKLCSLDLYYPVDKNHFTTIVWLHGGGLTGGEKEIPQRLIEQGFAVVGVGYRKSPHVKAELIIDDAASALSWVFDNISKYGGDESKIIIAGYSAGAYLALMLAMDTSYLNTYQVDAHKLLAVVALSGQTITHFALRNELGIKGTQPVVDRFAPLFHVRANLPPILLVTGDRELEMWGRYEENAYLKRMMRVSGHYSTILYELEGFDHLGMFEPGMNLAVKYILNIANHEK